MRKLGFVASFAAILAVSGCGKNKDDGGKQEPTGGTSQPAGGAPTPADTPREKELPPPPREAFKGQARLINLYLDGAGKSQAVDVWARRSIQNGPVELAKGVELGQATDWFAVPEPQSVVVVPAGAGADAKELGGIFGPAADERVTGVLEWEERGPSVASVWESPPDKNNAPKPPAAGKGLVVLRADALMGHEQALTGPYGGRSFEVGDGGGSCLHQRVEDEGFSASVLGGTQPVLLELPPGKATITFHKWPGKCDTPAVYQVEVEVADGKGVLVHLFTRDGKTLDNLQTPLGL